MSDRRPGSRQATIPPRGIPDHIYMISIESITVITLTPKRHSSDLFLVSRRRCQFNLVSRVLRRGSGSALRNRVLLLEAGLQILDVHLNAGLRAFWCSPEILDGP